MEGKDHKEQGTTLLPKLKDVEKGMRTAKHTSFLKEQMPKPTCKLQPQLQACIHECIHAFALLFSPFSHFFFVFLLGFSHVVVTLALFLLIY